MSEFSILQSYFSQLAKCSTSRWEGRVTQVIGSLVESEGPFCSVGECCQLLDSSNRAFPGEIVGFKGSTALSMALERPGGLRFGDRIITWGAQPTLRVGDAMLGRVLDGAGEPLDSLSAYVGRDHQALNAAPPLPLSRVPIKQALGCGVRALDTFLTCGCGQRMGIFGGSGVGKSTLLGMMARGTAADLTVLALVGERGREVRDFLEEVLGDEGRRRSVVVVSTSDQSPLLRIRAALAATAIAEYFCRRGREVLLVVDSLTRLAMAQREIGLAAGEPPTAKGYTPSVFSFLARLLERAGRFEKGSITAFYTVLMEGDDQQDPLVDNVRALLDGHIVLDRSLTAQNHYPPISLLDSLSRLMPSVCTAAHLEKAQQLRRLLATYRRSEDLIQIGAYQRGSDQILDRAIEVLPEMRQFVRQRSDEVAPFEDSISRFLKLPS
jgi:flagellum-specific ATP synthase